MSQNRRSRKLYDALTKFDGELMGALFTTYNFNAQYFEGVLLPKLLGVRVDEQEDERISALDIVQKLHQTEIVVIADGKVNKSVKKNLFGYQWIPVFSATQHSKIFILQFEDSFRLIIGSGNLTESGLHRNQEVYVEIDLNNESEDWPLFLDVLEYLEDMSKANGGRCDRLLSGWRACAAKLSGGKKKIEKENSAKFIGVSPVKGKVSFRNILDYYLDLFEIKGITARRVDELYILSPFFEEEPNGGEDSYTKTLLYREYFDLKGDHTQYPSVYLYFPTSGENITTLVPQLSYTKVSKALKDSLIVYENPERQTIEKKEQIRFPHGKLYVVTNHPNYTLTILGSSNFSPSGFGQRGRGKSNWEANVAFFSPSLEKTDLKALFPKDKEIPDDLWQKEASNITEREEDPENNDDDLIVLSDARFIKSTLLLTAVHESPASFKYLIGNDCLNVKWEVGKAQIPNATFRGVSVEVRDEGGNLIQDIPIYFADDSYDCLEINVERRDLVDWIEARYLGKRQMPLSMLLEKLKIKKTSLKGARLASQVSTDEYLIYRIKMFNSLVSRIYDRLFELRNFPKRVEYHLLGKFGLLNCVAEYVEGTKNVDLEVFFSYQAVEVVSSVLSAFEGDCIPETKSIVRDFQVKAQELLDSIKSNSKAKEQINEYLIELKSFANEILEGAK